MANKNLTVGSESKAFELPISIASNGEVVKTLKTKDTYVDKDVKITITTPDASFEKKTLESGHNGEITATASIADNSYTTDTVTSYPITLQADAHVNDVTVGTKDAGFTASTDTIVVDGADATQNTKTVYIKAGELEGSGTVSVTGGNGVDVTKVDAQPENGFYIKASADGSVNVKTAGWLSTDTAAIDTDADSYYTLKELTFANAATTGVNYASVSVDAIPAEGFLYINEGYHENAKISLADIIPDAFGEVANNIGDAADYILHGYVAIDKDGKEVIGTMQDVAGSNLVFSATDNVTGTIATSDVTIAPATDKGSFNITGSHAVSGTATVTVDKTGYVQKDATNTGDVSGTASLNASIAKVKLGGTVSGDGAVTPVIGKETSSAKSDDAMSKTAPTDKHYVAVSTAAIAETATVSPKVTVDGYGTTSVYDATDASVTAGANASGTYYIGIDNGAISASGSISGDDATTAIGFTNTGSDENISKSGILSSAPTDGSKYITMSASADSKTITVSGNVSSAVTEGYVVSSQATSTDVTTDVTTNVTSANQYIKVYEGLYVE